MDKLNLTAEALREILSYDHESGEFTRLDTHRKITCRDARGYIVCGIKGRQYKCHRLAWLYVYGSWPANGLDHIDGNKANNAIANLRIATQMENSQNLRKTRSYGSSGCLGVSFASGRWQARINVQGESVYLGRFKEKDEAYLAYITFKREHHTFCTI